MPEGPTDTPVAGQHLSSAIVCRIPQERRPVGDPLLQEVTRQDGIGVSEHMRPRTGPRVVLGVGYQPRGDGIAFHVADRRNQMRLIHGYAAEAPLEQIPAPPVAEVHMPRIAPVGLSDGSGEALLGPRHHYQMHMVVHQAVRPDLETATAGLLAQQLTVHLPVRGAEENRLAAVTALGHMVRNAGEGEPWEASHDLMILVGAREQEIVLWHRNSNMFLWISQIMPECLKRLKPRIGTMSELGFR